MHAGAVLKQFDTMDFVANAEEWNRSLQAVHGTGGTDNAQRGLSPLFGGGGQHRQRGGNNGIPRQWLLSEGDGECPGSASVPTILATLQDDVVPSDAVPT